MIFFYRDFAMKNKNIKNKVEFQIASIIARLFSFRSYDKKLINFDVVSNYGIRDRISITPITSSQNACCFNEFCFITNWNAKSDTIKVEVLLIKSHELNLNEWNPLRNNANQWMSIRSNWIHTPHGSIIFPNLIENLWFLIKKTNNQIEENRFYKQNTIEYSLYTCV